jgi:hypothetical protein
MSVVPTAERLRRVAQRVRTSGTADLVVIGLAGCEPLWPLMAEGVRLLRPFSAATDLQLFSLPETYAHLLNLLRDSAVDQRMAGDDAHEND